MTPRDLIRELVHTIGLLFATATERMGSKEPDSAHVETGDHTRLATGFQYPNGDPNPLILSCFSPH